MSGKLTLMVVGGPMVGRRFEFAEHNTFIFGRDEDCHMCLPDDTFVSRHHFVMEANPPEARIRDMGSLNGTYVNGTKYGSREDDETPEEAAKRVYPEVDLKDGDQIKVGDTILAVKIELPGICCQCEKDIPDNRRDECAWIGGTFICAACKQKVAASIDQPQAPKPVLCQECGNDVSNEIGKGRRGKYVCKKCLAKAEEDPAKLLRRMLAEAIGRKDPAPDIAGYEVGKELGRGGMGKVYLARRIEDGRKAALKVMLARVAVNEKARKEFEREIKNLRSLRHPHVAELIDNGSAGTAFYFVMEFCEGGSVDRLMEEDGGKLSVGAAKPLMLEALDGLAFIHDRGFVHRDLKPGNILLTGSRGKWTAKVGDFGLAKNFEEAGLSGFTVTGTMAGTPVFMPREQATNFKYVKPNTDVWSIGATFYNMLTGKYPREIPRGKAGLEAVLSGKIIPIREQDRHIPKKLAEVIDRALDNDVKARYQDAGEMRKALEKAL